MSPAPQASPTGLLAENGAMPTFRAPLLGRVLGWLDLALILLMYLGGPCLIFMAASPRFLSSLIISVLYLAFMAPIAMAIIADWYYSQMVFTVGEHHFHLRAPWLDARFARPDVLGAHRRLCWMSPGETVILLTTDAAYILLSGGPAGLVNDAGESVADWLSRNVPVLVARPHPRRSPSSYWLNMIFHARRSPHAQG